MTGLVSAPSAERNQAALLAALGPALPETGQALEIASGTGQHIAALAQAFPGISWQPTDIAADRFPVIEAWRKKAGVENLAPPVQLDACSEGWAAKTAPWDVVFLVNLLHLVSDGQMAVLLDEMTQAVRPGGLCAIYGPFLRDGNTTSDGDAAFHAQLREQDSSIGYKEIEVLTSVLTAMGFGVDVTEMPANNLLVLAQRPKAA